jgi:DNA-binding NarL/FixJ family response regulator
MILGFPDRGGSLIAHRLHGINSACKACADDHAIVRAGIRKMIDEIPTLEVVGEVGTGPEVFEALSQGPVDCLLIDVTMPDFEPIKAISRIRAQYPDLKILVVSAYDDDIYVQGLLGAGVNGYHLKDQPLNDLKLAVQRVLAGERWLSSPLIDKLVGSSQTGVIVPVLTNRQRSLLRLLQQGLDNNSIAQQMGLSVKTVENHLTRLYRQLDVQSRLEAVNFINRYPQVLGTPGQEAAQTVVAPRESLQKCATILVVDDNARYRKQLLRMIGKLCPRATIYEAESIRAPTSAAGRGAGGGRRDHLRPAHQGHPAQQPHRADQRLSRPGIPPAGVEIRCGGLFG